jgi:phosphorylcholine metabolism protein LicD
MIYDLMECIHQVFQEQDISYSVYGGTLLGAVRHKGLIPWDDDIDVIIPQTDVKKLIGHEYCLRERGYGLTSQPLELWGGLQDISA